MTEAVPLGELLHEEALFGLTGVRKVGVPRGRLFPSGLCLSAISRVVWALPVNSGLTKYLGLKLTINILNSYIITIDCFTNSTGIFSDK